MHNYDVKYPVEDAYPPGSTMSLEDLEEQGFYKEENAVVMRNRHDGALFILLNDTIRGLRWVSVRLD